MDIRAAMVKQDGSIRRFCLRHGLNRSDAVQILGGRKAASRPWRSRIAEILGPDVLGGFDSKGMYAGK